MGLKRPLCMLRANAAVTPTLPCRFLLQRQCTAPYRAPELWDVASSCTLGALGPALHTWHAVPGPACAASAFKPLLNRQYP